MLQTEADLIYIIRTYRSFRVSIERGECNSAFVLATSLTEHPAGTSLRSALPVLILGNVMHNALPHKDLSIVQVRVDAVDQEQKQIEGRRGKNDRDVDMQTHWVESQRCMSASGEVSLSHQQGSIKHEC